MSWVGNKDHFQEVARGFWPGATLTTNRVLSAITGGRPFAIGPWQIYKKDWTSIRFETLAHEAGHNWTYELLGWLIPIAGWFFGKRVRAFCGIPFFLILYFLPPFTLIMVFRCWFELIADRNRWRYMISRGEGRAAVLARAEQFGKTVNSTCSYLWAFPWIGPWWFRRSAKKLCSKLLS